MNWLLNTSVKITFAFKCQHTFIKYFQQLLNNKNVRLIKDNKHLQFQLDIWCDTTSTYFSRLQQLFLFFPGISNVNSLNHYHYIVLFVLQIRNGKRHGKQGISNGSIVSQLRHCILNVHTIDSVRRVIVLFLSIDNLIWW